MTRAFLGLGSNLGDRAGYLRAAVAALGPHGLRATSDVYETEPVGGPEQGAFLNLVAEMDTDLDARGLLGALLDIERASGRVREVRWGPRTLDLDIVRYARQTAREPDLVVPHPELPRRDWWLRELADLERQLAAAEGA